MAGMTFCLGKMVELPVLIFKKPGVIFLGEGQIFSLAHHQILNIFATYVKERFSLVRERRLKQAGCIPKFNCFPERCHSAWQEIDTVSTPLLSNCPQTRRPPHPSPKT